MRVYRAADAGGPTGGTGAAGGVSFSLPTDLAGLDHFKGIDSTEKLARAFHDRATAATKPFADQLPDDIKTDAVFRDIKDLAGLAKSYQSAAKMVGLDKGQIVQLPNWSDAKSAEDFYNRMGRPAKPEEYKFAERPNQPYSDDEKKFQEQLRPILHKIGLTQRQIDALVPEWNSLQTTAQASIESQAKVNQAANLKKLETELGAAFQRTLDNAHAALTHYDEGGELSRYLDETKLGDHPAMVKLFGRIGAELRDDPVVGAARASDGMLTPTEAKQMINAKRADKDFAAAYGSEQHPGHKAAVDEMKKLHELAYPEPNAA
jgi:hypothetical protein